MRRGERGERGSLGVQTDRQTGCIYSLHVDLTFAHGLGVGNSRHADEDCRFVLCYTWGGEGRGGGGMSVLLLLLLDTDIDIVIVLIIDNFHAQLDCEWI